MLFIIAFWLQSFDWVLTVTSSNLLARILNFWLALFFSIAHILASTELTCCSKKDEFLSDEALIEKNAVEIVKQMQVCKQFM